MTVIDVIKVFAPATTAFVIGIAITPFVAHVLYTHRLWKKAGGKVALDGSPAATFNSLHTEKEVGTPRFGGVVVWGSVLLVAALFLLLSYLTHTPLFEGLSFVSRGQTWLPFAMLMLGAVVGLIDDSLEVREGGRGGLPLRHRLLLISGAALLCAWWFYTKLEVQSIALPFVGPLELGIFFIPFFVFVALGVYAGGVIDGIDGLAGGVFASIFAAYAGIAFFEQQIDLAAFCATVVGALLAFVWFNIPPARFYLSETGTMGLTLALTVVAFLTDVSGEGIGVGILPIVALPLVATVLSVIAQVLSKRITGHKLLRVAPLHHHFEAIGWPSYKVTMRYWIVSVVTAILGVTVALMHI